MRLQKQKGFSITEVVIVLVIVAVLAVVITPAYQSYIVHSNRSDAIKSLMAVQIAEEKWRINNTTYGTLAQVWSGSSAPGCGSTPNACSIDGYYTMAVSIVAATAGTAYTITATAGTAQAGDTGCTTMTLTYATGATTKSPPAACWQ